MNKYKEQVDCRKIPKNRWTIVAKQERADGVKVDRYEFSNVDDDVLKDVLGKLFDKERGVRQ